MTTYDDATDFLTGGGKPTFKFSNVGDTVVGTLVACEKNQQTEPDGTLKWFDEAKTKPLQQLVMTLQTDLRDSAIDNDDGQRRIFVKGAMREAVAAAVKKAGAPLADGGKLAVRHTGTKPAEIRGHSATKLYEAMYEPPPKVAEDVDTFLANGEVAESAAANGTPVAAGTGGSLEDLM